MSTIFLLGGKWIGSLSFYFFVSWYGPTVVKVKWELGHVGLSLAHMVIIEFELHC